MIAPMKKVHLVLLEKEKDAGILALRELGLVHVEASLPSGGEYSSLVKRREDMARALNIVPKAKGAAASPLTTAEASDLAYRVIAMSEKKTELQLESGELEREIKRVEPWGDFDPKRMPALADRGVHIGLFEAAERDLPSAPPDADILVLSRFKKGLRLAAITRGREVPEMPACFVPFIPPREALASLRERLDTANAAIADIDSAIAAASSASEAMGRASAEIDQKIALVTVHGSFEGDGPLCFVKGYLPSASVRDLGDLARIKSWGLLIEDPADEDMTPTKVETGRFASIIRPVFDFLGVVPGYNEYEISSYFLVFFVFFSAMIFGDGGYGTLMSLGCLFAFIKTKRSGKPVSETLKLFSLISVFTLLWGMVTATWFSIRAENLPPFLVKLSIWPISSANPAASKNIQIFCFLLGALQLSIARIKNIVRDLPNPKFLGQLGSLSLIWGMLFLVLNLVVDSKRFPLPPYAVWLIVGGFAANLVFGAYKDNIFKSLAEGLKNIIPTFLSSVGVFADLVSYIRLWALGLAGSSLAAIINTMGGGLFKAVIMAVGGILILAFGHVLNMTLSVLSVVVHAIRLNILEFSCNHLGMQWSGIKYEPFRVTYKDQA